MTTENQIVDPKFDGGMLSQISGGQARQDLARATVDSMIFPADLLALEAELTSPVESELIARNVFPVNTNFPASAETVGFDKFTRTGEAAIRDYGDDFPLVDNNRERVTNPVVPILTGYSLDIQELRIARTGGQNIQTSKAATARRFVFDTLNTLAFEGNSNHGLEGLYTITGRQEEGVSNGSWTNNATTGEEMIDDIRQIRNLLAGKDGFEPQVLVMDSSRYAELFDFINTSGGTRTVFEFLRDSEWFPGGIFWSDLFSSGNESKIAVIDNRPEMIEMALPLDLTQHEPVALNPYRSVVGVEMRYGGLLVHHNDAIAVGTGV